MLIRPVFGFPPITSRSYIISSRSESCDDLCEPKTKSQNWSYAHPRIPPSRTARARATFFYMGVGEMHQNESSGRILTRRLPCVVIRGNPLLSRAAFADRGVFLPIHATGFLRTPRTRAGD